MYYIGIDVGGTNLAAGLVDEHGQLIYKVSRSVNAQMGDIDLCRELVSLSRQVVTDSKKSLDDVAAVGVGLPGLVDNERGIVVNTPNMPFRNTPLRSVFLSKWNIPVYLGNDANCAAVAEYKAGTARGCDPMVMVTIGTGLGGGMICGGKLFTGYAGSGMEVGHMIVEPGGQQCGCGNLGCWEQYGSASALIRITRQAMHNKRDSMLWDLCHGDPAKVVGRTAFDGARQGDICAQKVLGVYRRGLAVGLINLVNIIQPEIICLGGGVSNAEDELLLAPLRDLVRQGTFDKDNPVRLERASLGNDAGIIGAAFLCDML